MKEKLQTVWFIVVIEAAHFLGLMFVLSLLGQFTFYDGKTTFTYRELIKAGTVSEV